jgi:hypothetical protein
VTVLVVVRIVIWLHTSLQIEGVTQCALRCASAPRSICDLSGSAAAAVTFVESARTSSASLITFGARANSRESGSGLERAVPPWCSVLAQTRTPLSKGTCSRLREIQLGREVTCYFHASLRLFDVGFHPYIHNDLQFLVTAACKDSRGWLGFSARDSVGRSRKPTTSSPAERAVSVTRFSKKGRARSRRYSFDVSSLYTLGEQGSLIIHGATHGPLQPHSPAPARSR